MVKWKKEAVEGESCGNCKSNEEGICIKFTFPAKIDHIPCVKYKARAKKTTAQQGGNVNKLFQDLLNKLSTLKTKGKDFSTEDIIDAIGLLVDEYKDLFKKNK